jgi:hypothetical protein
MNNKLSGTFLSKVGMEDNICLKIYIQFLNNAKTNQYLNYMSWCRLVVLINR